MCVHKTGLAPPQEGCPTTQSGGGAGTLSPLLLATGRWGRAWALRLLSLRFESAAPDLRSAAPRPHPAPTLPAGVCVCVCVCVCARTRVLMPVGGCGHIPVCVDTSSAKSDPAAGSHFCPLVPSGPTRDGTLTQPPLRGAGSGAPGPRSRVLPTSPHFAVFSSKDWGLSLTRAPEPVSLPVLRAGPTSHHLNCSPRSF